jgi:hypothetical protein
MRASQKTPKALVSGVSTVGLEHLRELVEFGQCVMLLPSQVIAPAGSRRLFIQAIHLLRKLFLSLIEVYQGSNAQILPTKQIYGSHAELANFQVAGRLVC